MKFIFFLILFFQVLFINAQQIKIKGTVIDKETKIPICNVSIYDKKSNIGTITKTDGTFCLELKSNNIFLKIEDKNYKEQEINLILKKDTTIFIFLKNYNKHNKNIFKFIKK